MILVDTSVWIDHLRRTEVTLQELLLARQVLLHPFVIGELAMGNLRARENIIRDLRKLPQAVAASHNEILGFIDQKALFGQGIGYVDAHLLASVRLTPGASLWTRDKHLLAVSHKLGVAASLPGVSFH